MSQLNQRFTAGDVIGLTGITRGTLHYWGIPSDGGEGRGNHRTFDFMTVLGVAVAMRVFNSERGCVPAYCKKLILAFARTEHGWLLNRLNQGVVMLAPANHEPTLQLSEQGGYVNVEDVYRELIAKIEDMRDEGNECRKGRKTGLASS